MKKRFTQVLAFLTSTSMLISPMGTLSTFADDDSSEEYVIEAYEEEEFAAEEYDEESGNESEESVEYDACYFSEEPSEEIDESLEQSDEPSEERSESSEEVSFEEGSESVEQIYSEESYAGDEVSFNDIDETEGSLATDELMFAEEQILTEEEDGTTSAFEAVSYELDPYARSGKCGDNATWRFEGTDDNLTLIISGSGRMYDYSASPDDRMAPWDYNVNQYNIKSLEIENGITYIGTEAFYSCIGIQKLEMPDSIIDIGDAAFAGILSIETIELPDSVETIRKGLFSGCEKLKTVRMNGVKNIEENAFAGCTSLEMIHLPDTVEVIEEYAFQNCTNLKSINLPNSITKIGKGAFFNCQTLDNVVMPKNIHDLKKYTFYDCKSLKNIDFSNLERLTEDAFYNCDNLTELYFTEKTVEIQFWCFQACTNISKVTILNPTANLISPLNLDVKKATIVGHYESTAHDMAESFGFRFTSLEDPDSLPEPEGVDVSNHFSEKREAVNGSNTNAQNYEYDRWKVSDKSSLISLNDGFMRVQYLGDRDLLVEYYDLSHNYINSKHIQLDFEHFMGFYADKDAYYIVTAQDNPNEDDSAECFRVTKYNLKWKKVGKVGLYNCNMVGPGKSCEIQSYGDYLIIHTCRHMYKAEDGANHQSNITFEINKKRMRLVDSTSQGGAYGYVSHSFNQFVEFDNGRLITVDHGDAYPRSLVLFIYPNNVQYGSFGREPESIVLMDFCGPDIEDHQNDTNAAFCGFEISNSSYIVVGNSTDQTDFFKRTRNVVVLITDKTTKKTNKKWLTNYKEGDDGVNTPQLVNIGNDQFLILWSRENGSIVYYQLINGRGELIGPQREMNAYLSDCQPILENGRVTWYTYDNMDLRFYSIDLNTMKGSVDVVDKVDIPVTDLQMLNNSIKISKSSGGKTISVIASPDNATNKTIEWSSSDLSIAQVDSSGYVTPVSVGKVKVTATCVSKPAVKASCTVTVTDTIKNATVLTDRTAYTYSGKAIKPQVTVQIDGKQLLEGTDYTVGYDGRKNVGTGKITIKGKGLYAGSKTVSFKIVKAKQHITVKTSTLKVNATKLKSTKKTFAPDQVYKISGAKDSVTYKKKSGSKFITVSSNGTISIKKGTKKGTYSVVVKISANGNGNYEKGFTTAKVKVKVL